MDINLRWQSLPFEWSAAADVVVVVHANMNGVGNLCRSKRAVVTKKIRPHVVRYLD